MDAPDTRTPDRDSLAKEPFSIQLIDATEGFVLARLAPHATTEPSTDTERMASHLTHGVRLHAMHARLNARAVGLHEAWLSWRHLADLARMFSDHPDYREDFGRTIWEFPHPIAARVQIRLACGHRHVPRPAGARISLTRAALDGEPFSRLRASGRLRTTGDFTEHGAGTYTEHWYLLAVCSACVRTAPAAATGHALGRDLKEVTA
ncbi:hypothetical protein ACWC0C_39335 [Streptomyces sp. NPDC001709]